MKVNRRTKVEIVQFVRELDRVSLMGLLIKRYDIDIDCSMTTQKFRRMFTERFLLDAAKE